MLLASMLSWPLMLVGLLVGAVFYVGLGYLVWAGARLAVSFVRAAISQQRLDQRARSFGQAHPTLFDVAVARAHEGPASRPPAPVHGPRPRQARPRRAA